MNKAITKKPEVIRKLLSQTKKGDILEVILFDGAKFDNGESVSAFCGEYSNRRGYYPPFGEELSNEPGERVLGYFEGFVEDGIQLSGDFIDEKVIHSYRRFVEAKNHR